MPAMTGSHDMVAQDLEGSDGACSMGTAVATCAPHLVEVLDMLDMLATSHAAVSSMAGAVPLETTPTRPTRPSGSATRNDGCHAGGDFDRRARRCRCIGGCCRDMAHGHDVRRATDQ